MMSDVGTEPPPLPAAIEESVGAAGRNDAKLAEDYTVDPAPEPPVLIASEESQQAIDAGSMESEQEHVGEMYKSESVNEKEADRGNHGEATDPCNQPQDLVFKALFCLYSAQALGYWGDRMWDFAIALFFVAIWPNSLLLVAVYGLASSVSVSFLGTFVGRYVSISPRRQLIKYAVIVQIVSNLLTGCVIMMLLIPANSPAMEEAVTGSDSFSAALIQPGFVFYFLVSCIVVLAVVGALAGLAGSMALEKDWVVVIAAESSKSGQLGETNTILCRIDLISRLMAPTAVGILMYFTTSLSAATYITVWNLISAFAEYYLLILAYNSVPALAVKNSLPSRHITVGRAAEVGGKDAEMEPMNGESADMFNDMEMFDEDLSSPGKEGVVPKEANRGEGGGLLGNSIQSDRSNPGEVLPGETFENHSKWRMPPGFETKDLLLRLREFRDNWKVYVRQGSLFAAVSVALQFLTVLSFDALMTADLRWNGVPPLLLGIGRGLSATAGLGGTLLFPYVQKEIGTLRTGMYAVGAQWSFLLVCVISVFTEGVVFSLFLMVGVIGSRVGLNIFDLSATQLIQESVPEAERGVVGGVQVSLQEFCSMLVFAIGIGLPRPQDFWILVVISLVSTTLSAVIYLFQIATSKGGIWPEVQEYFTV